MQIYLYSSINCCTFAAAKVYITPRRLHDVKQQGHNKGANVRQYI